MAYVVVTGNNRKEFDTIREAISYRVSESRIYQMDAFGNMEPLNDEKVEQLVQVEQATESTVQPEEQTPVSEPVSQVQQPSQERPLTKEEMEKKSLVNLGEIDAKTLGKQIMNKEEKIDHSTRNVILKYILFFIILGIMLAVVYMILNPLWQEYTKMNLPI